MQDPSEWLGYPNLYFIADGQLKTPSIISATTFRELAISYSTQTEPTSLKMSYFDSANNIMTADLQQRQHPFTNRTLK